MATYESSILDPDNGSDCIIEDDDDDGGGDCFVQNISSYHAYIRSSAFTSCWTQVEAFVTIEAPSTNCQIGRGLLGIVLAVKLGPS